MQFSIVVMAALASLASAQSMDGIPTCALQCLAQAVVTGGCEASDQACQCGPAREAITAAATPCLLSACTDAADLATAASVGNGMCDKYKMGGDDAAPSPSVNTPAAAAPYPTAPAPNGTVPIGTAAAPSPTANTNETTTVATGSAPQNVAGGLAGIFGLVVAAAFAL
ncbi:uncharacterized protein L3040_006225 [Drepanopeziza brunnea f. sp. 'multigermtubi']|uniref:Effector CFEM8 n=1 Tax=Marssonina brunnea f. sp. multigermtubi (strain MB_m1) TaxID=1072389 RepID=CFM8_MARBU|nr:uncharacterized protein MBM_04516 [Drepanopeziza brunnea f. sp. 'multigermtubi' MB_m1]K1XW16.1 RecName: Full=Effector CFEM8; AltName: Full=MbCFEM8; Flags: Precursor [Drepanopeziza brunnea f. sp. 'multigermtubi' MB_m1]EKD16939.1 hypothetical protein MBM_04516 [Drepanopeziza brunnea f. sp. 'multigermtubi' MB_m1]KAJ5040573.1 hypothetical protein L3040_006225 [Drepanopeziza brunnea f. sp. 'multigermtubi']WBR35412.1 effector protein CFEM8 [Drepanopeziza brunnea]